MYNCLVPGVQQEKRQGEELMLIPIIEEEETKKKETPLQGIREASNKFNVCSRVVVIDKT